MSATQHTPGPWKAEGWEGLVVNSADGCTMTLAAGGKGAVLAELKANARLIAAAPDMLAASVNALALLAQIHAICIDGKPPALSVIRELARDASGPMRSAIARATGAEVITDHRCAEEMRASYPRMSMWKEGGK